MKLKTIALLLLLTLPSCAPKIDITSLIANKKIPSQEVKSVDLTLDDILKAQRIIAVKNDNTLYLVDPEFPKPYTLYGFEVSEKPTSGGIDNFIISPSKQWIVWYSPAQGIIAFNVKTLKTKIVQPADDFLNTFPYFEFMPNSDTLLCIIDNGNAFLQTELNSYTKQTVSIPYPYGNVFKVSPDQSKVIFISGFGQSNIPQFLITNLKGEIIKQFSADIKMTDRHMVFWSPDSSGLFLINQNTLQYYPISNPDSMQNFYQFDIKINITTATMAGNVIYLLTSDGYWHVIDIDSKKEVARAPLEIASELQKPKFYPWGDKQFLIEETVDDNPGTYNRLWLSDLRGVKKLVMDKYNSAIIQTFPEKLD